MNITKAQEKRTQDHLNRTVNYNGKITTNKEMIAGLMAKGYTARLTERKVGYSEKEQRTKKYKDYLLRHNIIPGLSNPNCPESIQAKQLKDDINKTVKEYIAEKDDTYIVITKTQYKLMSTK